MIKNKFNLETEQKCGFKISKMRKILWKVELDIFEKFIEVCKKYDINYFLIGGTAIGAVRHKGFIPWDDDIDIGMLRDDYNKFLKVYANEFSYPYCVQYGISENNQIETFLRIRNSNTTGIIKYQRKRNCNHGVFIEIYPFDKVPNNIILRKIHQQISCRLLVVLGLRYYPLAKQTFSDKICNALVFFVKTATLWNWWNACCQMYNDKKCDYVDTVALPQYSFSKECLFRVEDVKETELVEFEYLKVKIPKGNDRCLRIGYGDYMKLPPIEQRGKHHNSEVFYDPTKPFLEYINSDIVERYFNGECDLGIID